ncbi:unnamed protein product [Caenorhabditis bovis]|uniref:mitogen-activated protein kinase kinase n=1 Tax=Caenorhabditis bovis TaxID=2654633 RepID=A0A8S1EEN1_9PELO|nr:unnamed protein product [Caenorhabditis bovis]
MKLGYGSGGNVYEMNFKGIVFARKDIILAGHANPNDWKQVLRELETIKLCHKCAFVVQYFGYLQYRHDVYTSVSIFMEKLPYSCSDLIQKSENRKSNCEKEPYIPEYVCGRMIACVVNALYFLKYDMNIIHRDIKPSNILVDRDGRFKLCDFGISGPLQNSAALTAVGSWPYMAPEKFTNEKYDIKSDIWSVGMTVFEMAMLENPFNCGDYCTTMCAIQSKCPRLTPARIYEYDENGKNHTIKEYFTEEFMDFVHRILEKNPENRPNFKELKEFKFFCDHDIQLAHIGSGLQQNWKSVGKWLDDFTLV